MDAHILSKMDTHILYINHHLIIYYPYIDILSIFCSPPHNPGTEGAASAARLPSHWIPRAGLVARRRRPRAA